MQLLRAWVEPAVWQRLRLRLPPDRVQALETTHLPFDDAHSLVGGSAAHLTLGPGVTASNMQAGTRQGLALHVAREALQASQLQNALERRFEQAVAFDGCFIYIDAQDALVIWHALPPQPNLLDRLLSRMLSLANLETLDARTRR